MKRSFIAKEMLVNGQMAPVGVPTLMRKEIEVTEQRRPGRL
jgi:hypothetical protein